MAPWAVTGGQRWAQDNSPGLHLRAAAASPAPTLQTREEGSQSEWAPRPLAWLPWRPPPAPVPPTEAELASYSGRW